MKTVDGYKMFTGTMRISPVCPGIAPFEISGDWLYKPEFDCWYCGGRSFGAEICEVVSE